MDNTEKYLTFNTFWLNAYWSFLRGCLVFFAKLVCDYHDNESVW